MILINGRLLIKKRAPHDNIQGGSAPRRLTFVKRFYVYYRLDLPCCPVGQPELPTLMSTKARSTCRSPCTWPTHSHIFAVKTSMEVHGYILQIYSFANTVLCNCLAHARLCTIFESKVDCIPPAQKFKNSNGQSRAIT